MIPNSTETTYSECGVINMITEDRNTLLDRHNKNANFNGLLKTDHFL